MARSSLNAVDVGSPVSTEAGPFPAKSRRSCRRTNVTACRCRRQPTDDACTAVVHNEFDVDSVAAGCVDHVDPLGRRTPVGRTSLLSARVSYSRYADNAQSATAFGNCLFFSAPGRVAEYCDERACHSLCVCLSAIISSGLHLRPTPNFLRMLPMAVARSSSRGVVIHVCYVRPVLWMTSNLLISQGCSTSPPS